METFLPVGEVDLCVDTVGSPTDPAVLLIGTTVAHWDAEALADEIPGVSLLVLDDVGAELPRRAHAEVARALLDHTSSRPDARAHP